MAFKTTMIHVAWIVVVLLAMPNPTQGIIGMNWGRVSAQRLLPTQVVDLLLQNGIKHARIYTSEVDMLQAFSGSEIHLTMSITDPTYFAASLPAAKGWVGWKKELFRDANARRVIVGETVFTKGLKDKSMLEKALKSLENVQTALDGGGLNDTKATFTHDIEVLKRDIRKPSEAEFEDAIKDEMVAFVRFLEAHDAPFLVNMFPISDTAWLNFDPSFAFPDNNSTHVVTDVDGAVYTNIFEFLYDSFVWALTKIGEPKTHVVVSQVGWPTDGYDGANATAAERFFKSLLPSVISNKGTPMRPGAPIDIYIHALADEPKMPLYKSSYPFTRHWGIYRSNGMPKYKIDVSGRGIDKYPTEVKGIMRMPQRWCLYNNARTDLTKVQEQFEIACRTADCTSMSPGGSCSRLTYSQNVSYAFNMMFQYYFQDENSCNFEGLGTISTDDPSTPECLFPVEVVKGQQLDYKPPVITPPTSFGTRLHHRPEYPIFLAVLLSLIMPTFIRD
ncbi:hypothetical protein ACS0TY_024889 [Phlomoides rotata]